MKVWHSVNQRAVTLTFLYTPRTILSSKDLINKSTDQQALTLRTFPYYEAFTPLHRRRDAFPLSCEYRCLVVSGAKNAGMIGCLTIIAPRSRLSQDSWWAYARVNRFCFGTTPTACVPAPNVQQSSVSLLLLFFFFAFYCNKYL